MKKAVIEFFRSKMSKTTIICLSLLIITALAYCKVYQFDFINFDDDRYVFQNDHVKTGLKLENIIWAFQSVHASNWHPLTWISLMADAQIFNLNPGGYHVINLIFHLLNSILVFIVIKSMTGTIWRSAAVAFLFALHPLHVESVAWVAERKDVLSMFFMMLTLWSYVYYSKAPGYKRYLPIPLLYSFG